MADGTYVNCCSAKEKLQGRKHLPFMGIKFFTELMHMFIALGNPIMRHSHKAEAVGGGPKGFNRYFG